MIDINEAVLKTKTPCKTATIGTFIILLFCSIMAYFCAMPLIEGTAPDMPRTFLSGMTIMAIGFGLSSIYGLMNHLIDIEIDAQNRKVKSTRRVMGQTEKKTENLNSEAYFTEEITGRHLKDSEAAQRKTQITYELILINGHSKTKIYSGYDEGEVQRIKKFAETHNIKVKDKTYKPSMAVIGGTFLFMVLLLAELYTMGAFD